MRPRRNVDAMPSDEASSVASRCVRVHPRAASSCSFCKEASHRLVPGRVYLKSLGPTTRKSTVPTDETTVVYTAATARIMSALACASGSSGAPLGGNNSSRPSNGAEAKVACVVERGSAARNPKKKSGPDVARLACAHWPHTQEPSWAPMQFAAATPTSLAPQPTTTKGKERRTCVKAKPAGASAAPLRRPAATTLLPKSPRSTT
mmetsp:Transcript_8924/g.25622  ORF Transcript_8924/g.25622 Transcript_8924/m.25622 type:complete len:205 (+) Transcript_8924:485-1099(+)